MNKKLYRKENSIEKIFFRIFGNRERRKNYKYVEHLSNRTNSITTTFLYLSISVLIFIFSCACAPMAPETGSPEESGEPTPTTEDLVTRPWVYFIGNSITYVYDIPKRFHRLVMSNGGYPKGYESYRQHTPGAYTLGQRVGRLGQSHVIMDILYRKPRYIVLQEQSAGIHSLTVGNDTYNQIVKYLAIALAAEAELIIYQTWHRDNPEDFLRMATDYRLAMAPNGEIFNQLHGTETGDGTLSLTDDYTHQNDIGASLYAASFFYLLHPELPKIPGLIARTGYSLSQTDDDVYNQVVFNTVRNTNYSTTLRGITRITNIYNGVAIFGYMQVESELVSNLDNKGNSLDDPIILTGGAQTFDVDIPSYDIDIYQLPTELAGKIVTINFSNAKYVDWASIIPLPAPLSTVNWRNTVFLGDAGGRALNYTFIDGANIRFAMPSIPSYMGFIGGGIKTSDIRDGIRPPDDGQFTITISVDEGSIATTP